MVGIAHDGQRAVKHVAIVPLLQQSAFEQRLGQFFNEERHAIGADEQFIDDCVRQRFAAGHAFDQRDAVAAAQAG